MEGLDIRVSKLGPLFHYYYRSPKGLLSASSGLRQGDPLSPFLFVVVGEALGQMMYAGANANLTCYKASTF